MELDFELRSMPPVLVRLTQTTNFSLLLSDVCVCVCPCRRRCLRGLPMLSTFHIFVFKGLNQIDIQMNLVF